VAIDLNREFGENFRKKNTSVKMENEKGRENPQKLKGTKR